MGYYSEVSITLWKPDFDEMYKGASAEIRESINDKFNITKWETPDEEYINLHSKDTIKWYDSYTDVSYIMNFIKDIRHSFIELGEDYGDVTYEFKCEDDRGVDDEFYNFGYVHKEIKGLDNFDEEYDLDDLDEEEELNL